SYLLRRAPAVLAHAVWVMALVAALLLPLASIRTPRNVEEIHLTDPELTPAPIGQPAAPIDRKSFPIPTGTGERIVPVATTLASALWGTYLLFVLLRFASTIRAWHRTLEIRRASSIRLLPDPVERVWRRCLKAFPVHDVELRTSGTIAGPAA